jgi:aspartate/methionine/tyrosine aminotransferase
LSPVAVFDDNKHIPFATVGDMWSRTLSIYSSGKTFSATGWKIGWLIGPSELVRDIGGFYSGWFREILI